MLSLDKDLQSSKNNLDEFYELTIRVLKYLPNVISSHKEDKGYIIYSSQIANATKYLRPINQQLFIDDTKKFQACFTQLIEVFSKVRRREKVSKNEQVTIDMCLYTIQQSIGAGLDLLVNPNSARKHVGNRFEELIKAVFTAIGIANKKIVLQIPYETDEGTKVYKCENDLVISPYSSVRSSAFSLDPQEIIISIKTTSKDRMGKIFIDKILLERFVEHPQKVIGIFLNDVQRKESDKISYTLVSNLFMVYTKFLTSLEGIYYLDPPPQIQEKPYSEYMSSFSKFIVEDIDNLFSS